MKNMEKEFEKKRQWRRRACSKHEKMRSQFLIKIFSFLSVCNNIFRVLVQRLSSIYCQCLTGVLLDKSLVLSGNSTCRDSLSSHTTYAFAILFLSLSTLSLSILLTAYSFPRIVGDSICRPTHLVWLIFVMASKFVLFSSDDCNYCPIKYNRL